jgi:hypothetical protein
LLAVQQPVTAPEEKKKAGRPANATKTEADAIPQ